MRTGRPPVSMPMGSTAPLPKVVPASQVIRPQSKRTAPVARSRSECARADQARRRRSQGRTLMGNFLLSRDVEGGRASPGRSRSEVSDGTAQAFYQFDVRRVAEVTPRPRNISQTVANV